MLTLVQQLAFVLYDIEKYKIRCNFQAAIANYDSGEVLFWVPCSHDIKINRLYILLFDTENCRWTTTCKGKQR